MDEPQCIVIYNKAEFIVYECVRNVNTFKENNVHVGCKKVYGLPKEMLPILQRGQNYAAHLILQFGKK